VFRVKVLEIQRVSVQIDGTEVLEGVSLDVEAGDFVALIGPNGAGKTTLIRAILGRLRPHTGSIRIFGEDVDSFRAWDRLSYIPQHATNFDSRFPASAWEIGSLGRVKRRGLLRFLTDEDREAVGRALETVGMSGKANRRIGQLSGGERQRVMIARALASEPDVLILDEPTSGVDPGTQAQFYSLLSTLNEARGITILLSTHDLGAVINVVKTVACLNRKLICHVPAPDGVTAERLLETYGSPVAAMTHIH
jgi:zinc transport system ATP-binding protein